MPDVAATEPVTDAVLAAVAAASKWPVGDGTTQDASGDPIDTSDGYSIVYATPGGNFDGSMAYPHEDATIPYQVKVIGRTRGQCQHIADLNRAHLLTPGSVTPSGWKVMFVEQRVVGGPVFNGRDDTNRDTWELDDIFYVQITGV